jgi:hypothetical protein
MAETWAELPYNCNGLDGNLSSICKKTLCIMQVPATCLSVVRHILGTCFTTSVIVSGIYTILCVGEFVHPPLTSLLRSEPAPRRFRRHYSTYTCSVALATSFARWLRFDTLALPGDLTLPRWCSVTGSESRPVPKGNRSRCC